jgi:hypothetical protein
MGAALREAWLLLRAMTLAGRAVFILVAVAAIAATGWEFIRPRNEPVEGENSAVAGVVAILSLCVLSGIWVLDYGFRGARDRLRRRS